MKHLFILNPVAGGVKGRAHEIEREIRAFAESLRDPWEIYITVAPMDACKKIADEAESADMLYVYACGGDGTLNECANGAVRRSNVAITQYACGTGNDFIKTFGNDNLTKFRDLQALTAGTVRPIDLIDCSGRYGINICSVGIDARVGKDVHKYSSIPIIGGATGYVVALIVNVIKGVTQKFRISTEDGTLEKEITLVCACNGQYYGGGFNLPQRPHAERGGPAGLDRRMYTAEAYPVDLLCAYPSCGVLPDVSRRAYDRGRRCVDYHNGIAHLDHNERPCARRREQKAGFLRLPLDGAVRGRGNRNRSGAVERRDDLAGESG
jgi:diacylglycerol kinase family enzyme